MDIGSLIVAYIFVSSGVYLAEMQTIKREQEKQRKNKKSGHTQNVDETKPSAKSVFGRSIVSMVVLVLCNEGFLHWKDIAYFVLALVIGFVSYDFMAFVRNPKSIISLIPKVGDALHDAIESAEDEKDIEKHNTNETKNKEEKKGEE